MEKVVVIGGAGFLGSHIADELSDQGYDVVIFDTSQSRWIRSDQKMVVGDIFDTEKLEDVLEDAKYCYHFAGIADIAESRRVPLETLRINVMGASAVLEVARKKRVKRFVYASTMYVYSPFGSFYRASKQASEIIVESYQQEFGLDYTLLRYGSLYGPRSQKWNGLRKYVEEVVKVGRIEYPGTGAEKREYIHAKDAARLSVEILSEQFKNKAITVTGTQLLSSEEMLNLIFEIAGEEKDVVFADSKTENYHYKMTPYRYTPKYAYKLVPKEFIDLGQGILELVEEVAEDQNENNDIIR